MRLVRIISFNCFHIKHFTLSLHLLTPLFISKEKKNGEKNELDKFKFCEKYRGRRICQAQNTNACAAHRTIHVRRNYMIIEKYKHKPKPKLKSRHHNAFNNNK